MKYDYCLYARKSTENDEKQALSIDSQIKEMLSIAERDGLNVVEIKKESHSAKNSGERPVYNELIKGLKEDKFQGIITWATDRLSRNAGDLGILVDMMDRKSLAEIRTYNQVFANSPNDKFLLMILGSQAKLENDNRAINVVRGMKAKCEMGVRPCQTPLGFLNDPIHVKGKKVITIDPIRAPHIKTMYEMSASGVPGRKILDWCETVGFKTRKDKNLSLSGLFRLLSNSYYYGKFEWPIGSDTWYDVDHEALIDKELFDRVQARFAKRPKFPPSKLEFDYSGTMRCGECGSFIIAERKFKMLRKTGKQTMYVYYMCSRYTKRNCPQLPINEQVLIPQLVDLMDGVNIDKFLLKKEFEYELKRFHQISDQLATDSQKDARNNIDIRSQMKYVIVNGTAEEKKRLLNNLGVKILLKDKSVSLKI
jgi:DNA invertase Pin-like site-specific DNA recombinase